MNTPFKTQDGKDQDDRENIKEKVKTFYMLLGNKISLIEVDENDSVALLRIFKDSKVLQ